MRDKLIELIEAGRGCPDDRAPFLDEHCLGCRYSDEKDCDIVRLADYLIAHGVTVQKWIPVSERLPEETGEYNVMIKGAEIATSLWYSRFRNGWYNFDDDYYEEPYDDITHWMPLPEAPKEVE